MTFKQFIVLMCIATGSLWLGWWWTVISIDPFTTNFLGFLLFYLTLFLALMGTFTLLGVYIRKMRTPDALLFHLVTLSSRQGIVLSIIFVSLLLLQSQRWLKPWNVLLILIVAFAIEFSIVYKTQRRYQFESKPVGDEPLNRKDSVPPIFEKRIMSHQQESITNDQ